MGKGGFDPAEVEKYYNYRFITVKERIYDIDSEGWFRLRKTRRRAPSIGQLEMIAAITDEKIKSVVKRVLFKDSIDNRNEAREDIRDILSEKGIPPLMQYLYKNKVRRPMWLVVLFEERTEKRGYIGYITTQLNIIGAFISEPNIKPISGYAGTFTKKPPQLPRK